MNRERYAAAIAGALVAVGIALALTPGSLPLAGALISALVAILAERLFFPDR